MPREDVRCLCGYFFTIDAGVDKNTVTCPICTRPLAEEYIAPIAPPAAPPAPEETFTPFVEETQKARAIVPPIVIGTIGGLLLLGVLLFAISVVGRLLGFITDDETPPLPAPVAASKRRVPEVARNPIRAEAPTTRPPPTAPPPTPVSEIPPSKPDPIPGATTALPSHLLERVRREILPLHPYYLNAWLTSAGRAKIEGLASTGCGRGEDVEFLRTALNDQRCLAAVNESAVIQASFSRLERTAIENLPEDRIELVDGRTLDGRLLDETPEEVRFERRTGGAQATMRIKRTEIAKIEKGKGIGAEFRRRWQEARNGSTPVKASLLGWCRESGLPDQVPLVAYLILQSDPGHGEARATAGLPKSPFPASLGLLTTTPTPTPPVEQDPRVIPGNSRMIEYKGMSWEAVRLKRDLLDRGYVIFSGLWHVPTKRSYSLPGHFVNDKARSPDVVVTFSNYYGPYGTEGTRGAPQRMHKMPLELIEIVERNVARRFYSIPQRIATTQMMSSNYTGPRPFGTDIIYHVDTGVSPDHISSTNPSPLSGELFVTVSVFAPVMTGKVMTRIKTKPGGSATVYVISRTGLEQLYVASRNEDDFHPLPKSVTGLTTLLFQISMAMSNAYTATRETTMVRPTRVDDGRILTRGIMNVHDRLTPNYPVMIFPSDPNTREVFQLDLEVGTPAEELNRLFQEAGALELLQ